MMRSTGRPPAVREEFIDPTVRVFGPDGGLVGTFSPDEFRRRRGRRRRCAMHGLAVVTAYGRCPRCRPDPIREEPA